MLDSRVPGPGFESWPGNLLDFRMADDFQSPFSLSVKRDCIFIYILLKHKDFIATNPCFIKTSRMNCAQCQVKAE